MHLCPLQKWLLVIATSVGVIGPMGCSDSSGSPTSSDASADAVDGDVLGADADGRQQSFGPTRQLFDFDCNPKPVEAAGVSVDQQAYRFSFRLGRRADSFLMVPTVASGAIVPITLQTPSETVDLQTDYHHHNSRLSSPANPELVGVGIYGQIGFDFPILVPYAPQYAPYVVPFGDYKFTLATDGARPCLYVVESHGGTALDLNIYLVGAGGRTAADARDSADFQEVFDRVDAIFEPTDVQLGHIRFFDVPDDIRHTYRVIRSQADAHAVAAYGRAPDPSRNGHLSVDIFMVDDIQLDGANVLGLSGGLPGAAGLHGNARDGLVFESVDIGFDNQHVGRVLAHEIGHYLGLRHTTEAIKDTGTNAERQVEKSLGLTDPIADTPVCDNIQRTGLNCPDADNLMFPAAPLAEDALPRLTAGQRAVFQASPLVK